MKSGRIKWFNAIEAHGYIVLWDGTEVYFHATAIRPGALMNDLRTGAQVSFDLIETRAGAEAHNVMLTGLA